MTLLDLSTYVLAPMGNGKGIGAFDFNLAEGDVCVVKADLADDANLFLRALATLVKPEKGNYTFKGETLDFSDYRNLLSFKKKIAYIPRHSSLISNRTLFDNLQLMDAYFENNLCRALPEEIMELCRYFQIEDKLGFRPAQVDPENLRLAVIVRELCKNPKVILIDGPRHFLGYRKFDLFLNVLKKMSASGIPLVLSASDEDLTKEYGHKEAWIKSGILTVNVNRES
jgi:putative amino-acid transport system ATP-binding protein